VTDVPPAVQYARSGDVYIAYQVVGSGPIDLVYVAGFVTHLGVLWEYPGYRRFVERLGTFARVLLFDKRGMGLSDRVQVATLEERMDDVRAVMDAAGSERAVLVGVSEGGPMSLLFAATYPERTVALVLCGAELKEETTEEWPWGEATRDEFEENIRTLPERWAEPWEWSKNFAPDLDPATAAAFDAVGGRLLPESATPGAAIAVQRMAFDVDARHVLSSVSVPTLILHTAGDRICHVENARYLAGHIEGARYVELPGSNHVPYADGGDVVIPEIQEFLTGVREPIEPERVLQTVLFTDLVGSTEKVAEVGDRRWRDLLEAHHAAVRRQLERFRGQEIDIAGDGFFAAFDGPARAIRCAQAIRDALSAMGLTVRSGLHTGECELVDGKLGGIAVHLGARVASRADGGEILVSGTVRDLVAGSGIGFDALGAVPLKGIPGEWSLYRVLG
jgi:pimeloyl-ACP methyl ester carboxylesterase/class 3 adenylate cyclase